MYVGYARGWPPAHFVSGAFHINVFWTRGGREGAAEEQEEEEEGRRTRVLPFSHLRSILRGYRDETRVYYVREHVCWPLMTIDYPRVYRRHHLPAVTPIFLPRLPLLSLSLSLSSLQPSLFVHRNHRSYLSPDTY